MKLFAQAVKELAALGVHGDALVAAIERLEAAAAQPHVSSLPEAIEEAARVADAHLPAYDSAERKRQRDRERIARRREQERQSRDMGATSGDSRATEATVASDKDAPTCEGAQVVNPSSSLRSEGNPPVKPNGLTAPKGAETTRGTHLPESWTPDEAGWAYAAETLGPAVDPAREFDRFRDYWRAVPGAKGRKSDWAATWRNWCRSAADRIPKPRQAHELASRPDDRFTRKQANLARAVAGFDRVAGLRDGP